MFKLLETLEHRWIDVLPKLLAENPADRPANLTELVAVVRQDAAPTVGAFRRNAPQEDSQNTSPPRISAKCAHGIWHSVRRTPLFLTAAALAIAAVGYLVFSHRATPTASATVTAPDTFDTAFGTAGIYESPKK